MVAWEMDRRQARLARVLGPGDSQLVHHLWLSREEGNRDS